MSRELERRTVFNHLSSVWLPEFGPIAWPNIEFVPPENARWAGVSIIYADSFRASLGNDFFKRHESFLQIDLFTPTGRGSSPNLNAVDYLENIYQSLILPCGDEQLIFEDVKTVQLSINEERATRLNDNWLRHVISCEFRRDSHLVK